jgi:hypothetical protein
MGIDMETFVTRDAEIANIMECIEDGECCSIVGLSNTGKSTLLRSLLLPKVKSKHLGDRAEEYVFVYIDCNLMLELTEQGFYELILRSTLAELRELEIEQGLLDRVEASYRNLVNPANPFLVPLSFNEGLTAIGEAVQQRIVLLFDEFDEPFAGLDERIFLNLRALKDKYGPGLSYVVATDQPLTEQQRGDKVAEFCELFALNTLFLSTLGRVMLRKLSLSLPGKRGWSSARTTSSSSSLRRAAILGCWRPPAASWPRPVAITPLSTETKATSWFVSVSITTSTSGRSVPSFGTALLLKSRGH